MLAMRTGPVMVTGYDTYKQDDRVTPMVRRDGSPVEFVRFMVDGEDQAREITLDGSVNGSRVPEGTRAELLIESTQKQDARISQRTGRPYIATQTKFRVTGFATVK